eukprot:m.986613 g.986613  ORF g.986613 m.986613 type:complete len:558 (-) comp23990_c0_seq10:3517-5190(-)
MSVMDADDILENLEESMDNAMFVVDGTNREEIQQYKIRKRAKEDLYVSNFQIKGKAWEHDSSCVEHDVYVCKANALDKLNRRNGAITCLQNAFHTMDENEGKYVIALALAKLLFRADREQESLELCTLVYSTYEQQAASGVKPFVVSRQNAVDAFYLAGWVKIHGNDHTGAYATWTRGHRSVPEDSVLLRQFRKRDCWDSYIIPVPAADYADTDAPWITMVGHGAYGEDAPPRVDNADLIAYSVPASQHDHTPALALFDPSTQRNRLVFKTKHAVLAPHECDNVLRAVNAHVRDELAGVWGTVRHSTVKTTDVAVEDIPALRPWLRELLRTRLCPLVAAAFPVLADGTSTVDPDTLCSRVRVHDAFIVRYDAVQDKSLSLPEHCDTSSMSFTVALNSRHAGDFVGGGTWFESLGERKETPGTSSGGDGMVVDADKGEAVLFAGPLRHAGYPIVSGTRVILVLFLYVHDFPYGDYIHAYEQTRAHPAGSGAATGGFAETEKANDDSATAHDIGTITHDATRVRPSGDAEGGFVVYRQTVELADMLNRSDGNNDGHVLS